MKWREHAASIISKIISEYGTADLKLLRQKLREAYPYGLRQYHPYKIWCDEIKRQLGLKKSIIQKESELLEQQGQTRMF